MAKWFDWKQFFSEHQEWHAWVIGLGDGMAFRSTNWEQLNVYYGDAEKMRQELHYYKFGLGIGMLIVIAFIFGGVKWLMR